MSWWKRWWPALAWAVLISLFSTHTFTMENTASVIIPILRALFPHASPDALDLLHFYIRKCAHFSEYFIFALLVLRGIRAGRRPMALPWMLATTLLVVAVYASLDEFHQSFVPGRTAAVRDVLIDTAGGATALLVAGVLLLWTGVRQRNRGGVSPAN
jgi:VanZ family protein